MSRIPEIKKGDPITAEWLNLVARKADRRFTGIGVSESDSIVSFWLPTDAGSVEIIPFELKTDLTAYGTATARRLIRNSDNWEADTSETFEVSDLSGYESIGSDNMPPGQHGGRGWAAYNHLSDRYEILRVQPKARRIYGTVVTAEFTPSSTTFQIDHVVVADDGILAITGESHAFTVDNSFLKSGKAGDKIAAERHGSSSWRAYEAVGGSWATVCKGTLGAALTGALDETVTVTGLVGINGPAEHTSETASNLFGDESAVDSPAVIFKAGSSWFIQRALQKEHDIVEDVDYLDPAWRKKMRKFRIAPTEATQAFESYIEGTECQTQGFAAMPAVLSTQLLVYATKDDGDLNG
jgi:hypothetical protein